MILSNLIRSIHKYLIFHNIFVVLYTMYFNWWFFLIATGEAPRAETPINNRSLKNIVYETVKKYYYIIIIYEFIILNSTLAYLYPFHFSWKLPSTFCFVNREWEHILWRLPRTMDMNRPCCCLVVESGWILHTSYFIYFHIFIQLQSMRYYKEAITIYYAVWTRLTRVGCFEWFARS